MSRRSFRRRLRRAFRKARLTDARKHVIGLCGVALITVICLYGLAVSVIQGLVG